jgi:hypothetical protein
MPDRGLTPTPFKVPIWQTEGVERSVCWKLGNFTLSWQVDIDFSPRLTITHNEIAIHS